MSTPFASSTEQLYRIIHTYQEPRSTFLNWAYNLLYQPFPTLSRYTSFKHIAGLTESYLI